MKHITKQSIYSSLVSQAENSFCGKQEQLMVLRASSSLPKLECKHFTTANITQALELR